MSDAIRVRLGRSAALSLVLGMIVIGFGAVTALAAGTSFTATYPDEKTTFQPCPAALRGDICFTGVGHGSIVLGTKTIKDTEEDYAGFVDPKSPGTIPGCPADHNVVSIRASRGTLFLTTTGSACGAFDDGTWQAVGGTDFFEGATGGGTVHTTVLGPNPDGTLNSSSTYLGTLNLHGD
jgi:hypothetical protein